MKKAIIILLSIMAIVAVGFFCVETHPMMSIEFVYATVTLDGERTELNAQQTQRLNELLADLSARRCFSPANYTETKECILVDITTESGPMHIYLGEKAYMYGSGDDTLWYSVNNSDTLMTEIKKIAK